MSVSTKWELIDQCLAVSVDIDRCRQNLLDTKPDWIAIVATANDHFIGPALWTTLSQPRLQEVMPHDVCAYFEMIYTRNAERNARIRQQCLRIGEILESAGLSAVLLKGAAWLFDGSGASSADRMMRDIDLLVAADDIEAAAQALISAGYRDSAQTYLESGHMHFEEHGHFHRAPLLPNEGEALVEIHQDIAYRTEYLPGKELIDASNEIAPGLLLPALQHRILHNVIHAQVSNSARVSGQFDPREGLDLARLIEACGPEFDWSAFAAVAARRNCFRALSGAIHVTHRILGSPLPLPFVADSAGRWHGWRCYHQRRWPMLASFAERVGQLEIAFSWDRDAYALSVTGTPQISDHLRVNRRRGLRLWRFFSGLLRRRQDPSATRIQLRSRIPDERSKDRYLTVKDEISRAGSSDLSKAAVATSESVSAVEP